MNMNLLPDNFIERLKKIIPAEHWDLVLSSFNKDKPTAFRINTLKASSKEVLSILEKREIIFFKVHWYADAIIIKSLDNSGYSDLIEQGFLYKQGLSSMLVPIIFDARENENILDCCASPGSKTSQISAIMKNNGNITAIENIKERFYKLKNVLSILGVNNVSLKFMDARKFRSESLFDRILVDAPCSSEGRFNLGDKKSFAYWSPRKIKEMRHKQKGILLNALRFLKPGGALVYSTCTFAPEENEAVIDWALRKVSGIKVVKIELPEIKTYPCVDKWNEKNFDNQIKNCLRILPDDLMDGFFIAKIIRG